MKVPVGFDQVLELLFQPFLGSIDLNYSLIRFWSSFSSLSSEALPSITVISPSNLSICSAEVAFDRKNIINVASVNDEQR